MTIYMKISGIEGDVTSKGHEQWIQLESFHVQSKRQLNTQAGRSTDKEHSRPVVSEVTITKRMDQASPKLFQESVVGLSRPQIQIDMINANDTVTAFMQYTLSNVVVSAYSVRQSDDLGGLKNQRSPLETMALNFDKIEMRYVPRDAQNKPASPITSAYDLKEATAA